MAPSRRTAEDSEARYYRRNPLATLFEAIGLNSLDMCDGHTQHGLVPRYLHHKNIDAEALRYQKRYRDGKSVPFIVAAERDTYNDTHVPAHIVFRTKKGWIKEFTILSLSPSREGDANRASVEVVYYIFGIPLIKEFTVQQLVQRGIKRFGYAFERAY